MTTLADEAIGANFDYFNFIFLVR